MPDRLRVLWLVKGLGRGGVERLLVTSLPLVDRTRYDLEVAYVLPWKDAFVPEVVHAGIALHCLGDARPGDPRWVWRLWRLLRRDFDVVHTHMPLSGAVARVLAPRRVRVVHTEHNVWERHRRATRWANAWTASRCDAILAVSQAVADSVRPPRPVAARAPRPEVVLHGPDVSRVRRGEDARAHGRALLGIGPDPLVVGTVGNLTAKKDQRTMLAAIARVSAAVPGVQLVIVGSGPLEAMLRERVARDRRLRERVVFTGSRDDVPDLLPAFDVFCLSSLHEGLSIALLEAMATGVACVSTRAGGTVEVITDGVDGLLVDTADPDALADALRRVLLDDVLRARLAEAGRRRAETFDLRRAVAATEAVYERVVALSAH